MELTIKGTPDELKNVLQAICGSKEHFDVENFYKQAMGLENCRKFI